MCISVVYSGQNKIQISRTLSSRLAVDPVSQCEWLGGCGQRRKDIVGLMSQETRLRQLSCSGPHSSTIINQTGACRTLLTSLNWVITREFCKPVQVGCRASEGLNTTNEEDFGWPGSIPRSRFICLDLRSLSTFRNRLYYRNEKENVYNWSLIKWHKLQTAAAAAVGGYRLFFCCLFSNFLSSPSAACLLLTFQNWWEPSGARQTNTIKTQQSCYSSINMRKMQEMISDSSSDADITLSDIYGKTPRNSVHSFQTFSPLLMWVSEKFSANHLFWKQSTSWPFVQAVDSWQSNCANGRGFTSRSNLHEASRR